MSIGVVGLGYVGLPLVVAFAEAGEQVVAIDVDEKKIAAIEAGRSYIEDVPSERLQAVRGSIEVSTHFAPLARTDAVSDLRADPADAEPRAGSGPVALPPDGRWVASCSAASSSCWNRPHIPARRASS